MVVTVIGPEAVAVLPEYVNEIVAGDADRDKLSPTVIERPTVDELLVNVPDCAATGINTSITAMNPIANLRNIFKVVSPARLGLFDFCYFANL